MKRFYTFGVAAVFTLAMAVGVPAQAATVDELGDEVDALRSEVKMLTQKVESLTGMVRNMMGRVGQDGDAVSAVPPSAGAFSRTFAPPFRGQDSKFKRDLHVGIEGQDVRELQEMLAKDPSLYPEGLVTGYYGPLTGQAVDRLRKRHGQGQGDFVDAATLNILINILNGGVLEGLGSSSFDDGDEQFGDTFSELLQAALEDLRDNVEDVREDDDDFDEDEYDDYDEYDEFEDEDDDNDFDRDEDDEDDEEYEFEVEIRHDFTLVFAEVDGDEETFILGIDDMDRIIEEIADRFDISEDIVEDNIEFEYDDHDDDYDEDDED